MCKHMIPLDKSGGVCKHVGATMYGVGARLDHQPELLFLLRGVKPGDLLASATKPVTRRPGKAKVLEADDLSAVFGIDIADG